MAKFTVRRGPQPSANLQKLLHNAKTAFKLSEDGKLSAESLAFSDFIVLISLWLEHPNAQSDTLLSRAITHGIKNLLTTGDESVDTFIRVCNQKSQGAISETSRFAMWADLHLIADEPLRGQIRIDGVRLCFSDKPPRFLKSTPHAQLDALSVYDRILSQCFIWGTIKATDEGEAGSLISTAFEKLQAFVNFQAHFRRGLDMFRPNMRHVSAFQIGPNFYLFNRDREKWSDTIWMSEQFNPKTWIKQRVKLSAVTKALSAIKKHEARLQKSPFSDRLFNALKHLNASWITPLRSERALSLWMALESLYSERSIHTDQNKIIKRATKDLPSEDRWIMEQRLLFIAEIRNSSVHAHRKFTNLDSQEHVLQVCNSFVMSCYIDIIGLSHRVVKNENDLFTYLDGSADPQALEKRVQVLKYKASKMRAFSSANAADGFNTTHP